MVARRGEGRRQAGATGGAAAAALAGALLVLLGFPAQMGERRTKAGVPGGAPAAEQARTSHETAVRFTISVSGDMLIHSPVFLRALANGGGSRYDFRPMFRPLRRFVARPELALCHVETPLTDGPPTGYPLFSTPTALARAIAASGWDACSTASNHALDRGQAGLASTIAALRRAGLRHSGTYRSARAARRPVILRVAGVRVALLSYTETTNGIPPPRPWSVNLLEPRRVLADARRARLRGARVVIVNVHWGPPEYASRPTRRQHRTARRLARSGRITAIVGQGPHVVWPIRRLAGRPVVFSEGNLISNQTAACCAAAAQDGLIALLDVVVDERRARVERVRYVPVWVRHPDYAVLPVGLALRRGMADPATLAASYRRTVAVAGRRPGVRPLPRRLPR